MRHGPSLWHACRGGGLSGPAATSRAGVSRLRRTLGACHACHVALDSERFGFYNHEPHGDARVYARRPRFRSERVSPLPIAAYPMMSCGRSVPPGLPCGVIASGELLSNFHDGRIARCHRLRYILCDPSSHERVVRNERCREGRRGGHLRDGVLELDEVAPRHHAVGSNHGARTGRGVVAQSGETDGHLMKPNRSWREKSTEWNLPLPRGPSMRWLRTGPTQDAAEPDRTRRRRAPAQRSGADAARSRAPAPCQARTSSTAAPSVSSPPTMSST